MEVLAEVAEVLGLLVLVVVLVPPQAPRVVFSFQTVAPGTENEA